MILLLSLLALAAEPATSNGPTSREQLATQIEVIHGLIDSGMAPAALELCSALREEGASGPEFDIVQARAMAASGMRTDARAILLDVVVKYKRNAEAWAQLGIIQADLGDPAARASLERALELDPEDAEILNNLGYIALSDQDYSRAEQLLRASIKADPSRAQTRNNLALTLALQEKDMEALELFRSTGTEAQARYNMGVACEWRHDNATAIVHYQAAIAAQPGYEPAVFALKKLLVPEETP